MANLSTFLCALLIVGGFSEEDGKELEKFRQLFMNKRIEQLTAVKNIIKLEEAKRKNLLDQITSKLFQVSSELTSVSAEKGIVMS